MKILAQIVSIEPLALIVSLPNQLFGHVPITQISSEFTSSLESLDADDSELPSDEEVEGADAKMSRVPDLFDLFRPGQYLRCVVAAAHAAGATKTATRTGRARDDVEKASRRVELSLIPEQVNQGVVKTDLVSSFVSNECASPEQLAYVRADHVCLCQKCRRPRLHSESRSPRSLSLLILQRCEESSGELRKTLCRSRR